jgi:hypothetical protein
MKQEFVAAVANKKLAKVRISLTNELLLDPRGTTFGEMLSYAMSEIPELFDENKEAGYTVPSQEEWDEDFLFKVKNDLDSNFSREKLAFYETVVKTVGKSKGEEIDKEERRSKEQQQSKQQQSPKRPINKTYATVSAGGATLALVGLVAGKTLLTVVGGAVLIVGGVLLLNDKMERQ